MTHHTASPVTASRWIRFAATAVLLGSCSAIAVALADDKGKQTEEAKAAVEALGKHDASIQTEIGKAAGYAIFPGVGKGGIGIGGARGTGQVVASGAPVAKTTLTQVTVGLQLGGQKYIELILFENKDALDRFLDGKFTLSAQATAVAAKSGAAANAKYAEGVKVITMAIGGLMYEATVGGQKFGIEKY